MHLSCPMWSLYQKFLCSDLALLKKNNFSREAAKRVQNRGKLKGNISIFIHGHISIFQVSNSILT